MTTVYEPQQRVATSRLWWVAPPTMIAAALANLIVYAIATALFAGPRQFSYLTPLSIVISTAIYLLVAAIVYAVTGRFSKRPIRVFRVVALIALLLSFAAPLSATQFTPPADATTVVVLLVMHVVAAMITIGMFTTLARTPGEDSRTA
jgi:hypothetical protein